MLELAGYYDGVHVQFLEGARIKKNQILKIIVTNDFVDEQKMKSEPLPAAASDEAQRMTGCCLLQSRALEAATTKRI